VDTYQAAPEAFARFATMNPFHFEPGWRIPVPGLPGRFACSVESVWQGLKLFGGELDLAMFSSHPYKRPPDSARGPGYDYAASRFRIGDHEVDLVTARLLLYLPTYLYLLDHLVPEALTAEIHDALVTGTDVVFFDWDANADILDPRSSFSHSSLLASWFNGDLDQDFLVHWRGARDASPQVPGGRLALDRYRSLHGGA
jgi:hypothetical protein